MGMYDSVNIQCPNCKGTVQFQSKAGDCTLGNYTLEDAPREIQVDLDGRSEYCSCGWKCTVKGEMVLKCVLIPNWLVGSK